MTTIEELKKIAANERPSVLRRTLMDAAAELESLTALVEAMKENILVNGQLFEEREKALTARVRELEADKERLDWLQKYKQDMQMCGGEFRVYIPHQTCRSEDYRHVSIRSAIDAARKQP